MYSRVRCLRLLLLCALVLASTSRIAGQEAPQIFQGEEVEKFLTNAKITAMKGGLKGVTMPRKATLELNGMSHFAVFKTIDEKKSGITQMDKGVSEIDFQDSWRTEVAAYELDKLIGLRMVPATVERTYNGERGSLQIWVDSMMPEAERVRKKISPPDPESWNRQIYKVRMFDNLIYNTDRHLNNILIKNDWQCVLIDHSRTFRWFDQLREPKTLTRFSKSFLEAIGKLDEKTLTERTGRYLTGAQIKGILKRRDLILDRARELVSQKGERAVLFP